MRGTLKFADRVKQALLRGPSEWSPPSAVKSRGFRALPFTTSADRPTRLVVVSNRLPIVVGMEEDRPRIYDATGGLVTALSRVLRRWGGLWIGWPGDVASQSAVLPELLSQYSRTAGFDLVPVSMSKEEVQGFYQGFCNEIIWPLFHDLQSQCNFVPGYWAQCKSMIERFAQNVAEHVDADDFVWVQDYHLMGLGRELRQRRLRNRLGLFLHIPFPPPDIFAKLPWRSQILESLLYFDLVGFQAPRDLENFKDCLRAFLPTAKIRARRELLECTHSGHTARFGVFPIGIDYQLYATEAAEPLISQRVKELKEQMPGQQIALGLDRLDYTKGIPCRLKAFHLALKRYPELHRHVTLLQVVVPSREAVPEYQELKAQVERLVAQINGEFAQPGWVPINYVFRSLEWGDLLSYYRAADVALVTPLKDGMNLVAKEYCACQIEGDGVLILSEFAGAAVQLKDDAILVNPYDLEGVADAIHRAVSMTSIDRSPSMRRLREAVQSQDVYWWVNRFLGSCGLVRRAGRETRTASRIAAAF